VRRATLLLLLALPRADTLAAQASLRIEGNPLTIERVQGYRLAPAAALSPLGARVQLDNWHARLFIFDDTIEFFSQSPFLRVDGQVHQLISPAIRTASGLQLPVQFFSEWLPKRYSTRLSYRDGTLGKTGIAIAPGAGRTSTPPPSRSNTARNPRIVVIDAGHGGKDPGTASSAGLLEKSATMAVANRLAGFLRELGYEVHMTRTTDTLIALADRPAFANRWKNGRPAAVFISLHANSGARGAAGFETYFLSQARTEDERRVAEMENAAVQYEDESPREREPELDQIFSSLKNDFYLRASNSLAESIQTNLATVHPGPNRGVKQAGFRVLIGAIMPAVLVELGFMSNSGEARMLGTSEFQQKVAWGLAQAINKFFDTHAALFTTTPGQ
jgi:N-acetylmuramoyl-L-alanine amidase